MEQLLNVNDLIDEPLAGCNDLLNNEGNFLTFTNSLVLRLALYSSRKNAKNLFDQLVDEFCYFVGQPLGSEVPVPIKNFEYVINELQYELRRASRRTNDVIETGIIKEWILHITRREPMDDALEFLTILKTNRDKRIR